MDAMPNKSSSLTVPLIVDEEHYRIEQKLKDVESNYPNPDGDTSFLKSIFNGLNALSGYTPYSVLCDIILNSKN